MPRLCWFFCNYRFFLSFFMGAAADEFTTQREIGPVYFQFHLNLHLSNCHQGNNLRRRRFYNAIIAFLR
jgi:hypothetical protein